MRTSFLLAIGLSLTAGVVNVVGCSSETGNSSTSTTSTSTTTSSSQASAGSTGGTTGSGGAGGGMAGSTSSSASSTSGGGGAEAYTTCGECTSGSEKKECGAEKTACDKDQGCLDVYNCVYAGCTTDKAGGCCTLACFTSTGATQASINLYKAFDSCVYCTTCKDLCTDPPAYDATEYCKAVSGMTACP